MADPINSDPEEEQVKDNEDANAADISSPQHPIGKPLLKPITTHKDLEDYAEGKFNTSEDDDFLMQRNISHTVFTLEDLLSSQSFDIAQVSDTLLISRASASRLLRKYNWKSDKLYTEWRFDEDRVRESVGLLKEPSPEITGEELECQICFQVFPKDRTEILNCGHLYCLHCWRIYITTAINDNAALCLMLTCPQPSCNTAVLDDVITSFASENEKRKFQEYLVRSYVEYDGKFKWCPAPNCDFAVQSRHDGNNRLPCYDVVCRCLHRFCWNCQEESHYPVACDSVAQWIFENGAENQQEKYSRYYESWMKSDSERKKATENLGKAEQIEGVNELMTGSWELIIECRRILKWSYAFGYYLDEAGNDSFDKDSFDNLQARAEECLEKFHKYAEEQTEQYFLKDFAEFREDLLQYINITKKLFNNLVLALQKDLPEASIYDIIKEFRFWRLNQFGRHT